MSNKKESSRRKFLKQSGYLALGASSMFSSLSGIKAFSMMNQMKNKNLLDGEYKALVCFYFTGGCDSFNMFMPKDGAKYDQYQATRSNLAIPSADILQVDINGSTDNYGFHPSMPEVQSLFNQDKLSVINNIGMLIEPTTRDQIINETATLPLGLYSHSDQIEQWGTASPHHRTAIGWAGRMAELLQSANTNSIIPMNISLNGNSVLLGGETLSEYVINQEGSVNIEGYGDGDSYESVKTESINSMLGSSYDHLLMDEYKKVVFDANNANLQFQGAINAVPDFGTTFSPNGISQRFEMVAKTIAARETLGFNKQVFLVQFGGWDHHDELLINQAGKLAIVSKAMSEFNSVLEEMGLSDNVTTFTMSEFGRTLTSNGNGTDHAWGGNVMVMGGAVNGGQMFGEFPSLDITTDNPLYLGDGSLLPSTATDLYFAELAKWFGVEPADLSSIFPNIGNFYDVNSTTQPLGFLNI